VVDDLVDRSIVSTVRSCRLALDRWVSVVLVLVVPLLFVRGTFTVFTIPKVTVVLVAAAALVTAEVAVAISWGVVGWSDQRVEILAGLLVASVLASTVVSDHPGLAFTGVGVRYSGALTYIAYAVILRSVARSVSGRSVRMLVLSFAAANVGVVCYGLVQTFGRDPLQWAPSLSFGVDTISTLGNPNFAAAFTSISMPFLVGLALCPKGYLPGRVLSAAAVAPAAVAIGHFRSLQGHVAVMATVVVLLVWLSARRGRALAESVVFAVVFIGVLGVAPLVVNQGMMVVVVGVAGMALLMLVLVMREEAWDARVEATEGLRILSFRWLWLLPVAAVPVVGMLLFRGWDRIEQALGERMWFWDVGIRLFLDRPILGHGLETYGTRFAELRSAGHAMVSPTHLSNSVHSVPLGLLLGGGLVLGAVYLAINGLAAWCGVRAIRRATGDDRIRLASVLAAWLAFHLQSLVSVDVAGLGVLHWILTGVLLGHGLGGRVRSVALPWSPNSRESSRPRIGVFVVVSAVLVALWSGPVFAPLRADWYHHHAMLALARSEPDVALIRIEEALLLQPSNPDYAKLEAAIHRSAGRYSEALAMSERAAELQPGNPRLALEAAHDAVLVIGGRNNLDQAIRWYEELVRIDPMVAWSEEAADFFEAIGRHDRAEELRNGQAAGPESGG
jgi:hypothetical protein